MCGWHQWSVTWMGQVWTCSAQQEGSEKRQDFDKMLWLLISPIDNRRLDLTDRGCKLNKCFDTCIEHLINDPFDVFFLLGAVNI